MTSIDISSSGTHIEKENPVESLDYGQYFRFTPSERLKQEMLSGKNKTHFIESSIYMCAKFEVNLITDHIHSVVFHVPAGLHNTEKYSHTITVLYGYFLENFVFVPTDIALREREQYCKGIEDKLKTIMIETVEAINNSMVLASNTMKSGDQKVVAALKPISDIKLLTNQAIANSSTGALIASGEANTTTMSILHNQKHLLTGMKLYTEAVQENYGLLSTQLVSIRSEQMVALKNKAEDMVGRVGDVQRKLDIIQMYCGDDVEVEIICDGELSSDKSPINIYAQIVYMDEELIVHSVLNDINSFDYRNTGDFFSLLKTNKEFFNRLFTKDRMVACIQFTRDSKEYGDMLQNMFMNQINRTNFIMIRDGGLVYAVFSKLNYMQRLYPTQQSMDQMFERTSQDDTEFVKYQKRFKGYDYQFKNLCYMLQGLADGTIHTERPLLGPLPAPARGNSFVNQDLCAINVNFLDDESNLLGSGSIAENATKWIHDAIQNTGNIENSDLVFGLIPREISWSACPSLFNQYHEQKWEIDERALFSFAYKHNDGINIKATATKYRQRQRGNDDRDLSKPVYFQVKSLKSSINVSKIKPSDLSALFDSRLARRDVSYHMQLLKPTMKFLKNHTEFLNRISALINTDMDDSYALMIFMMSNRKKTLDVSCLPAQCDIVFLSDDEIISDYKLYRESVINKISEMVDRAQSLKAENEHIYGFYRKDGINHCFITHTQSFAKRVGIPELDEGFETIFKDYEWHPKTKSYSFCGYASCTAQGMAKVISYDIPRKVKHFYYANHINSVYEFIHQEDNFIYNLKALTEEAIKSSDNQFKISAMMTIIDETLNEPSFKKLLTRAANNYRNDDFLPVFRKPLSLVMKMRFSSPEVHFSYDSFSSVHAIIAILASAPDLNEAQYDVIKNNVCTMTKVAPDRIELALKNHEDNKDFFGNGFCSISDLEHMNTPHFFKSLGMYPNGKLSYSFQ